MIDVKDIESAVNEYLEGKEGFFLVKAEVKGANQINVEIDHDSKPIDIDTIVELTRHIEGKLDREVEDFELEVSSAGLTTPLESPRRYRKFKGKELEVILKNGIKEKGVLLDAGEENFQLQVVRLEKPEGERRKRPIEHTLTIAYEEVKKATYLIQF